MKSSNEAINDWQFELYFTNAWDEIRAMWFFGRNLKKSAIVMGVEAE